LLFLLLLGVGVGLINSSIIRFFPFWMMIFRILTGGLLFFSGVIKVPDMYDLWLRNILVWNPILHGVSWFHVGIYGDLFPHVVLDRGYLVACSMIALSVGLMADRATLRYAGR
jgi:capsular polysaccharide transport system permease protein